MSALTMPRNLLVAVRGGDITEATAECVRDAVTGRDARVAFLHLPDALARGRGTAPAPELARWRRVAATVPPERLFVEAIAGDPADVIVSQARRFGSDLIVLGTPAPGTAAHDDTGDVVRRVVADAPCDVVVPADAPALPKPPSEPRRAPRADRPSPSLTRRPHGYRTRPLAAPGPYAVAVAGR